MKKTITALTAATLFFAASPSYAQVIDDAGAAKLQNIIQEQIDYADKVYGNIPSMKLKHEGEVSVTQHDGYYQVVLPEYALEMEHPTNAADKLLVDFGQMVMNVVPEGDDALNMSVAMPMPILGKDSTGQEVFQLNIGQQKAHALYVPSISATPKYSFSYQDVKMAMPAAGITLTINDLSGMMNLEPDASGYYSGPSKFSANMLKIDSFSEQEGNFFVGIGDIVLTGTSEAFDLAGMTQFQKEMGEADMENMTAEESAAYANSIVTLMLEAANGMDTDFSLKDMTVNFQPVGRDAVSFSIKDTGFGFGLNGMRGENISVRLSGNLNGLSIPGIQADFQQYIPTLIDYKMNVTNMPMKGLLSLLSTALQPDARGAEGLNMAAIQQMLSEAGTKYTLENHAVDMPALGTSLKGEAVADNTAMFGFTAQFFGRLRNLNEMLAESQAKAQELPPMMQQALMPLMLVQQLGKPGTDEKTGQSVLTYDFVVSREGKMLVNGQDAMMMMMGGGQQPPQQQPMQQQAP
ncbi:MAG: hypothetical protein HND56_11435 [Pseudomonadota bacterium]|nr:hypothetical protein [Pseudomonadota bacterium]QKK06262.1 MAG: hypothetical protein HND56_11435 [Pseudomonadota bacterium]